MYISSVTLRRKYNLGNYENIELELTAELIPFEDPLKVLAELQAKLDVWIKNFTVQGGR